MKKLITIILAVLMVSVFAVGLVACDKDEPKFEKTLTAEEAENLLFGTDGAVNRASKAFNVKGEISNSNENYSSSAVVYLVLDSNNEKMLYVNNTYSEQDGAENNDTYYMFHHWTERSNGSLKDNGIKHLYSLNGGAPQVDTITDNVSLQNSLITNCGLHGARKYIAEEIHNSNRDVYDTIQYSAKAYYGDEAMTVITKIEITMTYYIMNGDEKIDGTSIMVLENKEFTLANGTTESGLLFTSISTTESDGDSTTVTYTYGVDSIELPDVDAPETNWPAPVEL